MRNSILNILPFLVAVFLGNELFAQCEFTISPSNTFNGCLQAEEDVIWKNASANLVINNNYLTKSGSNGWNAGAESTGKVQNYGYASTIVNETNTNRMFGLSNTNTNNNYNTIEYAIYLRSNGYIGIYESGTHLGNFGTYSTGDTAKIAIKDGTVFYYLNSNLVYTSSVIPSLPLLVDVSLNTNGSTLENVIISNGTDGSFTSSATSVGTGPTYQWKLNGMNVGTNSPTYANPSITDNDTITCQLTPGVGGCGVGPFNSNNIFIRQINLTNHSSVSISTTPISSKCDKTITEARFTNMGSNMIANNNNLTKNGANGWNGGAVSIQSIDDNGEAYTIINETNTNRFFGLTNSGAENSNQSTIDYAIYLVSNGTIRIYETGTNIGSFGTYSSGDTARIVAEDGNIYYYINSNLLYTSAIAPVFPLYVDVSINTDGGTLENIHLISGTAGNFNADVINGGANPTYQWKLNNIDVGSNSPTYSNPTLNVNDIVTCEVTPDAVGCIPSAVISNSILFNQINPTANSSVSISTSPTASKCDKALTVAAFTSMGSNMIANGNSLTKNGPNGWDGGAVSFQSIDDNGEAYTIINETNTNRMFGLTNSGAENSNFTTIDYAMYLRSNGVIRIYEAGTNKGDFGGYSSGDTARIVAEDGNIYYYINGNLLYTSAITPVFPLYVDVCINTDGATLENVHLISGTAGNFNADVINGGTSPSYQWKLNGFNVGTNSATYSNAALNINDVITCEVTPDAAGCSVSPILSNTITFNQLDPTANSSVSISTSPTASKCDKALTVASFTNMGSNMAASGNDLVKNGSNGWDGGAVSFQSIDDNGEAYTIINETNTTRVFGLTNSGASATSYTSIDFAIYLRSNGEIRIYESGTYIGIFGSYTSGDTARVVAEDGNIYYYINSNLLYASTIAPVFPLYADVSIFNDGGTLEGIHLISGTAGNFNADVINGGASPSYQWKLNGFNVGTNSATYSNASLNINDVITCEVTPDAAGCSVSPILSNSISFYNENPTINTSISISTIPTANKCEKVLTVAAFTSMGSNMTANGNDLVKTGANGWDGGAVSFQSIDDNGEAYTIINETNTNRMFGLTNSGAGNSSYTNIDYAIYLLSNGTVRIYESGTNRGNFGTYSSGDTARIVAKDGNIYYYINSNLLYTSAIVPIFPLYVDVSINNNGGTLEDIHLISGSIGDFNADVINAGANPTYQWKLNGLNVGTNSSTYSNPSLNVNDVVTCEVTPDAVGCSPIAITSNTITMNSLQLSTQWNGGNTDWFNGSNWSNGVPNINTSAVISGAAPTMPNIIGADANCQGLTIESGANLTITGSLKLSIAGSLVNNGTLTTNSSTIEMLNNCDGGSAIIDLNSNQDIYNLVIDNTNNVALTNGTINLSGTLTLTNGNFSTNNALTLISDASGTARIAEITGGSISGDITMQRYIDAGSTNWRFITSAVSNTTLADFNDDFITSGFTGSDFPNFPSAGNPWVSIYYYDETVPGSQDNGYVPASNITNAVGVGEGLWIWSGDTSTGTQPFTIDVTGPANTGNINLPISYTNSGSPADDGWNMVGNPYPSTIDWDDNVSINKTGINDAIYIWNPELEQFASYVFGLGTNGGSRYIASSQAFWVQATASGASVQVTESTKVTNDAVFLRKKSTVTPLTINVENNSGTDQAIINFNNNATLGFDGNYDALKLSSSNTNLPSVSTLFDSIEFSINQIPEQGVTIPLKVTTGNSGMHSISFDGIEQFNDAACLIVEDLFTGKSYDLKKQNSFSCFINSSTKTARFLIKFGAITTTTITNATCFGSNDGSILLEKEGGSTFDIVWKDENDIVISSEANVSGISFLSNVLAGTYLIETTDAICGNLISSVTIDEPQQITAQFTPSSDTVYLSNGGIINFTNASSNANTYIWDFGDGNSSYINEPTHQYTQSGIYNVTLNASLNGNCSEMDSKNITVLDYATAIENTINNNNNAKVWINNSNLIIESQNAIDKIEVRNLTGQILLSINKTGIYKTIIHLDNIASQMLLINTFSGNNLSSNKISFVR
ncbi:MAG: PKD domain-containing protein [Vicingus serpentipes]|nr:PKD domain-containing protein [Vicingus serpentipes]